MDNQLKQLIPPRQMRYSRSVSGAELEQVLRELAQQQPIVAEAMLRGLTLEPDHWQALYRFCGTVLWGYVRRFTYARPDCLSQTELMAAVHAFNEHIDLLLCLTLAAALPPRPDSVWFRFCAIDRREMRQLQREVLERGDLLRNRMKEQGDG